MRYDRRWQCTTSLNTRKEEWERTASGRQFCIWEKRGTKRFKCAVSLDLGGLTRRGLLEECIYPGVDSDCHVIERAEGEMLEKRQQKTERPPTCLRCEISSSCASASS